jgi:hypothetical protein
VFAAGTGTALANKVSYGAFLPGHPHRVVMSFYLVGPNCPWGPHCFDHAQVTEFGAGNYGYPNCPQVLEGAFSFGDPNTGKPTAVSVGKQLAFGGHGRSDTDDQIRVAFHGRFLKNRSKATGWFEVHNYYCTTGKLSWTATLEK